MRASHSTIYIYYIYIYICCWIRIDKAKINDIIYIYIYIHVIRDQSLITVRGGYKSKARGGSEVLPLPGTYTHRRPCPYKKIKGGGERGV